MRITDGILSALEKAVSAEANRNQFARKVGVPQHTIVRWLEGKTVSISDSNYEKLYPYIKPYFPRDDRGHPLPWNFSIEQPPPERISNDHDSIVTIKLADVFRKMVSGKIPGCETLDPIKKYHFEILIAIDSLDIDSNIKREVVAAIEKIKVPEFKGKED